MKQRRDMILHLLITILLISYSCGQLHITCINSTSSGRQCLSYINKTATWENASSYCISRNGTLVVLENTGIISKINSSLVHASINVETCWIGGYRQSNKWIWLNGNNITQTQFLGGKGGNCVNLNVKNGTILNYYCKTARPFICQFNIEYYEFCVPGVSWPNKICYTYMKNGSTSWCKARNSCLERGGDLASLENDVETWGKFLLDAPASLVFVGAAYNLTRWQWLDGNNITRVNKTFLKNSPVCHCATLILHDDSFALLPIHCDNPENFAFLCKRDALPAAFTSMTVFTESPTMSSEKGNVSAESITFSNLQKVSYGISSKGPPSDVPLTNPISKSALTSSLTNSTEKSPTQLSMSSTNSAIVLGTSISSGIFVIATILIIILFRRRQLFGKRPLLSSKKFSEGEQVFSMHALSHDLEPDLTFLENPLYDPVNISPSVQEK